MGKIKPRFSKTVGKSYPSFGCAYCDSIFGNHFVQEAMMEMRYYSNSLPKAQIEIQDEIYMPADCWYIKEIFLLNLFGVAHSLYVYLTFQRI